MNKITSHFGHYDLEAYRTQGSNSVKVLNILISNDPGDFMRNVYHHNLGIIKDLIGYTSTKISLIYITYIL